MEDDLEEMKALRERNKYKRSVLSTSNMFDPQSNFKKAVENSEIVNEVNDKNAEEQTNVSSIMGFSGFGKKARQFDFNAIFEQTRRSAIERNQKKLSQLQIDMQNDDECVYLTEKNDKISQILKSTSISSNTLDSDDSDDEDFIGPPIPLNLKNNDIDEEVEIGDVDVGENRYRKLPISHEVQLHHGNKPVSALALDPNGARLVSGGFDFDVMFWDFAGMDSSLKAFRDFRPCECHQIKNLEYSHTGDSILVVSGSSQAKVLDRDGIELAECVKGDQYITDMARTKGHVAMLNDGCWHPKERDEFITCSNDGTVRMWRLWRGEARQKHVIKPRTQSGLRALPTACSYSRDGFLIATGCSDGSIQMWDTRKPFVNTSCLIRNAHQNGKDVSCLSFSYDGQQFASRGCDDTLKLWDIRKTQHPVNTANDLFNLYPMTDCSFSPDDKLIMTGTSLRKGDSASHLVFFQRSSFEIVEKVSFEKAGVVRSLWHPKLNQILVGTSIGFIKVFYNPSLSERGAKLCVVKTKRKVKDAEVLAEQQIITPHALPLFKQDRVRSRRKQMEKDRMDPIKSHRPDLPVTGPGQGGRLASAGNTLSSFIVRNIGITKRVDDNLDPREAILKYAKEASENPYWVTPAYAKTQPKPVFQEVEEEPPSKKLKSDD